MVHKTLEEQIALLQQMGNPEWARKRAYIISAISLGLIGYFLYSKEIFFAVAAILILVVSLAVRDTGKHMQRAAKAWRQGRSGEAVLLLVKDTSDDDNDLWQGEISYKGERWKIDFITPFGWNAESGNINVKIYTLDEIPWPVLFVTQQGILIPRSMPKRSPRH